jgi:hypothetical protein
MVSHRTDSFPTAFSGGVNSGHEEINYGPAHEGIASNSTIRFESGIDPSTKRCRNTIRVNTKHPCFLI